MSKVGVVTPWFGEALKGGAEQQAWQLANRLADNGWEVEVLTTCCASFQEDWSANHHPAGVASQGSVAVRRFEVDERDSTAFDEVNAELLGSPPLVPGIMPISDSGNVIWRDENINSSDLENYLAENVQSYDAFVFLPYLYGVTLRGLPLVAEKAWLQPCLHDEAYAYLTCVSEVFYQARGFLFISEGEQRVAAKLYGPIVYSRGEVVGAGVEDINLDSQQAVDTVSQPFVLCLGRRCEEKGTDRLVSEFSRFKALYPESTLQLVLAGPGDRDYSSHSVIDLGLVEEPEKAYLLQRCVALCNPSANESFSRVIYEAWSVKKPVLVNADCVATAVAVENAAGGWLMSANWSEQFRAVELAKEAERIRLGAQGADYQKQVASWDAVIEKVETQLFGQEGFVMDAEDVAICQILPDLSFGDAISSEAIQIHRWLREAGIQSRILAREKHIHPKVAEFCEPIEMAEIEEDECVLYHHSIGSNITNIVVEHAGRKALIYHNITPPEFFERQRPDFARLLRNGREEMWSLSKEFSVSAGDSLYNMKELEIFGFDPLHLPLSVDPEHWNQAADPRLMRELQDGRINILFVGRYAPNKGQHRLVSMFSELIRLNPSVRLVLAGSGAEADPYLIELRRIIEYSGLAEQIFLTGQLSQSELHAVYRTASVFVCLSEHEGFGVPLLEAMWFDVPVVARRFAAVGETMAEAGLLVDGKHNDRELARLVDRLLRDKGLTENIVTAQRKRRVRNLPDEIWPELKTLLRRLVEQPKSLGVS